MFRWDAFGSRQSWRLDCWPMPCPGICARRRPRRSAMPVLMMPSGSAVTRYRMSGEPRRALQDTATASVRNARQLSRAALRISVPPTAMPMSLSRTVVPMSRTAVHLSVTRTAVPLSLSRSAAHMSTTGPTRATTATIAVIAIIAASTSSPSSETLRRDAIEREPGERRGAA
jgi:hypothetical protein